MTDNNDNKFNTLVSFELHTDEEVQCIAHLFAEFAYCLDPYIDSYELGEALEEFLDKNPLNLFTIQVMAQLARACVDKPNKHWN
jgi:hypothetical protein